ncbi:hypothetical protein VNI00_018532 [Paramarasmius palmivorus]|uniref:Uncharacterized protein n=1 Tax=Paramarasmius palmivorus TaxID=297713 RepID=A0AAW0AY02_9AGAR
MSFHCSGCNSKAFSYQGYQTHLRLSQNPKCRQLYQQLFSYVPSDSDSDSECDSNGDLDEMQPVPFEGDYFGACYMPEDFGMDGRESSREERADMADGDEDMLNDNEDVGNGEQGPEPTRGAPLSTPYVWEECNGEDLVALPWTSREVVEERMRNNITIEKYPSHLAGAPIHYRHQNIDEQYTQHITGSLSRNPYAPFTSKLDWEVARWAKLRGPGATAMTELLQITGLCERLGLSFSTSNELNRLIDTLPDRPRCHREEISVGGEAFEFYYRDVRECIKTLWADPDFTPYLVFAPERHYRDRLKTVRLYHDVHTGDWWWETQEEFEKKHPCATVVPIIISSDKTQVTLFRNKTAYPVYMTIGNLPKFIRRKPSRFAQILIAYLPTTKLNHIKVKASRRRVIANIFHTCMSFVLQPLIPAGEKGMNLTSGDGAVRRGFPVYSVFVGDYPEQLLVSCLKNGDCPIGVVKREELGELDAECTPRDIVAIRAALDTIDHGYSAFYTACSQVGIKPIQNVFWQHLPNTNIYTSITPDVLHQLFQGIIKHVFSWIKHVFGHDEIDARCRRLPPNHNIRLFLNGITHLSRITGTEHAQLCQFILGIIIDMRLPNGLQSDRLIRAVHDALRRFHADKQIFIELGVRKDFNIPKLHFCRHYRQLIERFGTTDNYSTEYTERLHIDTTKDAYAATNHRDEYCQMTAWLDRKEKIVHHDRYVQRRLTNTFVPSTFTIETMRYPPILVPHRQLFMARHPSVNGVTFHRLVSVYGAKDFLYTLAEYVAQARAPGQTFSRAALTAATRQVLEFVPFSKVSVYHRIKFTQNDPYSITKGPEFVVDAIHADPGRTDKYGRIIPGRFDTALVKVDGDGNNGVKGYRVGQVRCVFTLPPIASKEWFPSPNIQPAKYLAYIEWFTPFKRGPERNHLMYKVSRAFRPDNPSARLTAVIPVDSICRSVHLIPRFGSHAPQEWKSSNVLELCDTFFVNDFVDRATYATIY